MCGGFVENVVDDPVKTLATVGAVATGNAWAVPIIAGVDTALEGGDLGDIALSAGTSYATGELGNIVGSELGGDFATTGEDFDMGISLGDADIQPGGFYGGGATPQATIIPGELGDIILDANGNVVTSSGADILAAPSSFSLSPGQALQGLRAASGLLGGRQQPQQQMPQMQMGGITQMPQGAVDYSGIYNLLALQRAKNPNSLLG